MSKESIADKIKKVEQGTEELTKKEVEALEGIQNAEGNLRFIESNIHQIELLDIIEDVIETTKREIPNIQNIVNRKNENLKSKAFEENAVAQENTRIINESIGLLSQIKEGINAGGEEGRILQRMPDAANRSVEEMNRLIKHQESIINEKLESNRKIATGIANLNIR